MWRPRRRRDSLGRSKDGGDTSRERMAVWAYEFDCDRPLSDMRGILNERGPWDWSIRESYWYGDYLMCRPGDGVRILVHDVDQCIWYSGGFERRAVSTFSQRVSIMPFRA